MIPAPLNLTACGLPDALSVTKSMPVRLPVVLGVKVMLISQLVAGARLPTQLSLSAKWAVVSISVTFRVAPPELVSVTVMAPLVVPTFWPGNIRLVADSVAPGLAVKSKPFGKRRLRPALED